MADPNNSQQNVNLTMFQWVVIVTSVFLYFLYLYGRWWEMVIIIASLAFYSYIIQLGDGQTFSKHILVKQLVDMGVRQEDAIEAAEACSTIDFAMSFLNQVCDKCLTKSSKNKVLSMLRCKHQLCKLCAVKFFTQAVKEGQINKCVCPVCNLPDVTKEDQEYFSHLAIILNEILDLEHMHKFNKLSQELSGDINGVANIEEFLEEPTEKECGLCYLMFSVDEMESLFSCEHMCCTACIRKYFEVLLTEQSINNCSCPYCNKPDLTSDEEFTVQYFTFLEIQLQRILDKRLYDMFAQKLRDRLLSKDSSYKWCSRCPSGFFFDPRQKCVECPGCRFESCPKCDCEWENAHGRMTCEEFANWKKDGKDRQELENYLETAEKVICPACNFTFLLDRGGCLHFVCTECRHGFCYGCHQQFFNNKCDRGCTDKGLHAHHPRNCLYFLRDNDPSQLQQLLTDNNINFYTVRDGQGETCDIHVRHETGNGLVDALCGLPAPQGFAGLCRKHYIEYLCKIIWDERIDVSVLSQEYNLDLSPEASKSQPSSLTDMLNASSIFGLSANQGARTQPVQNSTPVFTFGTAPDLHSRLSTFDPAVNPSFTFTRGETPLFTAGCGQRRIKRAVRRTTTSHESEFSTSQTSRSLSYSRTVSTADTRGQDYEVAINCLLFLRAIRLTRNFFLAANHGAAGKLDDVVLLYQLPSDGGNKYRAILLQAKHKKRATIAAGSLSGPGRSFGVEKYLRSFSEIKDRWMPVVEVGGQRLEVQEVTLVLYSNAECSIDRSTLAFAGCTEPQHLWELLDTGGRVLRIREETSSPERDEFFSRFVLCLEQLRDSMIDPILASELREVLRIRPTDANRLVPLLKTLVKKWWEPNGTPQYLTRESKEWGELLSEEVNRLNGGTVNIDRELRLEFSEESLKDLIESEELCWYIPIKDKWESELARVRLRKALTDALVLDATTLEENLEEILVMLSTRVCQTLVVDSTGCFLNETTLVRLKTAVRSYSGKRLVIIGIESPIGDDWRVAEVGRTWPILKPECREDLLSVRITFQDRGVALRKILGSHEPDDIPDEAIATLRRSETIVQVGAAPRSPLKDYVRRQLQRRTNEGLFSFEWDPEEKKVVVDGVPGVGKSAFVTWVSLRAKDLFPGSWVIRLDIGQYSKFINEADFGDVEEVRKLLRVVSLVSRSRLEQFLLDFSLNVIGNVFLFVDGFDEISPHHTAKCCQLLAKIVENFRFIQLMVTTRPVTKKDVEDVLNKEAVYLQGFSRKDQESFMKQFFEAKGNAPEESSLRCLIDSDDAILEIPLLCKMAAQVLSNNVGEAWLEAGSPWRTVLLYERFTKQNTEERLREKTTMDVTCPIIQNVLTSYIKDYFQRLQELAVKKLFSTEELCSVQLSKEPPDDKLGLVVRRGENLDFEHRTFSEFFLGLWLTEHWNSVPVDVLRRKLYDEQNRLAEVTFSFMMFVDVPLHRAVSRGNLLQVQELLLASETARRDCGGRNSLHVAAMTEGLCREMWELLLNSGEDPLQEDEVCGWSVMSYAKLEGNLDMVEFLLEHQVPIGDLNFISDEEMAMKFFNNTLERDLVNLFECIWRQYQKTIDFRYVLMGKSPLHVAARDNSVGVVSTLIKQGYNLVDEKDDNGRTPLHEAARKGHLETTELLLELGADLNIKDKAGNTAFLLATMRHHLPVIKLLLEYGEDPKAKGVLTMFQEAAMDGDDGLVKALLKHGVDPNTVGTHRLTPLALAAYGGHFEIVELLLEHRDVLLYDSGQPSTALHMAAMEGQLAIASLLLEHKADPNAIDGEGNTALSIAVYHKHMEMVRFLLERGLNPDSKNALGNPVLIVSVTNGQLEIVSELLMNGANPNIQDHYGTTAMIHATLRNRRAIVEKLLEHGAEVNIQDNFGRTALLVAAKEGSHDTVKLLLQYKVDPTVRDGFGNTALHLAAKGTHIKTVDVLLKHKVDVNMVDDEGKTALHVATFNDRRKLETFERGKEKCFDEIGGRRAVIVKLLTYGADVNLRDKFGKTALYSAAMKGLHKIVKLLLQHKADLNIKDIDGKTALHVAAQDGHTETVELLLQHGVFSQVVDCDGNTALHLATIGSHSKITTLLSCHNNNNWY